MPAIPRRGRAPGYWAPRAYCVLSQSGVIPGIVELLKDKLYLNGRRAALWLPVRQDTAGALQCTCYKPSTQRSDARCLTCYGTQYAPGYLKFLHQTLWFASNQYATLTLTNMAPDFTKKPYRIVLTPGSLSGTIVTPDAIWTNPQNADWTFDIAFFREMATDDITVEFSKDAGLTWFDIADINGPPKPIGASGTIRFRCTITRVAATTQSPEFEIARLRRPLPEFVTTEMKLQRPDLPAGEILILRTWEQEQVLRNIVAGRQVNLEADGGWTVPLNAFDTRIVADTPEARIDDRQAGPHPFYEQREGIHTGQRDVMTLIRYNENLRVFTHQSFSTRKAQQGTDAGEMYNLVF